MPNGHDMLEGIPLPKRPWVHSHRFVQALHTAAMIHGGNVGKGMTIPYASHLLGTCSIALDYGANGAARRTLIR